MKKSIDFSSRFRILKGGRISLVVSVLLGSSIIVSASPVGGTVTSGTANISQNGNVTNINQSSQKASINWQDFSIKSNETVNFNQPSSSSITLNRVIGNEKSIINGALNANGQVWLLNSNGILFNKNASINTAGFLATTAELSDNDFNSGNYNFKNSSSNSVINLGIIEVSNNGSVVLASNEVKNEGTIKAVKGKVHLLGANEYSLNLNGNSLVELSVDKGVLDALVENTGTIIADGGEIYLTTNAVNELLKGVVNNTGVVEANSIDDLFGKVEVFAHGGTANVSGRLEAKDGFIETSGKELSVSNDTVIKTKNWLIDPTDVVIDNSSDAIGGATVGASVIETALDTTNVTIQADNDITVNENISWGDNTLLLDAGNDININAVLDATDSETGSGDISLKYSNNLTMQRDDDANSFTGKINLDSSSVVKISSDGNAINDATDIYTVINDITSLQNINSALSNQYVLSTDLDNSNVSFTPIGSLASKFTGNFEGFGHKISNILINESNQEIGMFGVVDSSSKIQNLGLIGGSSTGLQHTGSLVGYLYGNVLNSFSTTDVTGTESVGGLVGYMKNGATISNSYATGVITNSNSTNTANVYTGGLVGYIEAGGTLLNSYATGNVTGVLQVGGLVGISYGAIDSSYAKGSVIGTTFDSGSVGGLVGELGLGGTITKTYSTGSVNGGYASIGGLVGTSSGNIINSYSTSPVTGYLYLGGLVGNNSGGSITNSYSTGLITAYTSTGIGGLVGRNSGGSATNSFWDTQTSGQASSALGTGKTTLEMKTETTFTSATWDFVDETTNGTSDIWKISSSINNGYPCLIGISCPATIDINYTLSNITSGYTYKGSNYLLTDLWSTASLFDGTDYDSWVLGTDYTFYYSGGLVTGFTNANTYNNISIDVLKSGYALASSGNTEGSFKIDQKDLTISGLTASNKIYDGTTIATTVDTGLNLSGLVSGDDFTVSSTGVFADKNVGAGKTVTLTNTIAGTDASNYNVTDQTSTTASITSKELTISGLTSANKVYDGTTTATVSGTAVLQSAIAAGTGNSVDGKWYTGDIVNLTGTALGAFNDKDVSDANTVSFSGLTLTGTDAGNYLLANHANVSNTISKESATVTASSDTLTYNGSTQYGSFSASGLVNGENISVLNSVNVSGGLNPGIYTAIASGSDDNYTLTFIDGILTILPKPVITTSNNTNNIITPIINNLVLPKPTRVQVRTGNVNLNTNSNTQVKVTSQPSVGRQTKAVTLTQLKNEQNKEDNNANNDVVVPVGDNSLISLVNGGVNLPNGVDQQFYVVENEDQKN